MPIARTGLRSSYEYYALTDFGKAVVRRLKGEQNGNQNAECRIAYGGDALGGATTKSQSVEVGPVV